MEKILGLDLGANSIGWSLIELDEEKEKGIIIDAGVRIFQAGVDNYNSAKEQSKNQTRREARGVRRNTRRRRYRKFRLRELLKSANFIPNDFTEEIFITNPYELRTKVLDQKLSLEENARILYHLAQRRGFKSNRKSGNTSENSTIMSGDNKSGKVGINEVAKAIEAGNFRTLGEYLNSIDKKEARIRNRYTSRNMYEHEFEQVFEAQRKFYPEIYTDEIKKRIFDILFYQRPITNKRTKIVKVIKDGKVVRIEKKINTVGYCKFEPKKKRCPKHHPIAMEFRLLQQVNNLTLFINNEEETELTEKQRTKLINYLMINESLELKDTDEDNYKKLKKILEIPQSDYLKINLNTLNKLSGNKTYSDIRKALGEKLFANLELDEINRIWELLYDSEDEEKLIVKLENEFSLPNETSQKVAAINLTIGYYELSRKAISNILPFLREGLKYHDAMSNAGYNFNLYTSDVKIVDLLPQPSKVANPIVNVAMHQIRKVINCLIERYGKPDKIRIEMARDLKMSADDRKKLTADNKKMDDYHEKIRQELVNIGIAEPKSSDIQKYKLWKESKAICIYSGDQIGFHDLFFSNDYEIEHIYPYSRSLDNSFANKTICRKDLNNIKGNKTPFEAFGHTSEWEAIQERCYEYLPWKKKNKFVKKEVEFDDFITRQLNDTRYISREACRYLEQIVGANKVEVATGQLTSQLRNAWGFNSLISEDDNKNRSDHRHHAIDAVVVALTTRFMLNKASRLNEKSPNLRLRIKFPEPWVGIREDVKEKLENLIVSHKSNKRVRGQLHDQTVYGLIHNPDGSAKTDSKKQNIFAVRKPLSAGLTANEIKNIIDPKIKDFVFARLRSVGVDVDGEDKFKIPANAFAEPIYYTNSKGEKENTIRKVRIAIPSKTKWLLTSNKNKETTENKFVDTGSNHHIVIYKDANGKQKGEVVTLIEAITRKNNGLPVIDNTTNAEREFVTSLIKNEMILNGSVPNGFRADDKTTYHLLFKETYRVQKFSMDIKTTFRQHSSSLSEEGEGGGVLRKNASVFEGLKINIDPIGFVSIG